MPCPARLILLATLAWLSPTPPVRAAETYDLVIRGGRVIDGTGNPAFFADVAVRDRRIAEVGRITNGSRTEIDARGLVIAPGFIDVHTHAEDIAERPRAENFLRMGVTTLVLGNCGSSELRVGEFFRQLEAKGFSPNIATLIGHGTVRGKAMGGAFDRVPTSDELAAMKQLVEDGMRDGAVGLSTGLIYLPGVFAQSEEIVELAKVAARFDGIYASHMRHEDTRINDALNEVFRVAREAGIRAEVSHIKLAGQSAWGRAADVLATLEKARAEGLDITQDQYGYDASSTSLGQLVPDEFKEGGHFHEHYTNAATRAKIAAAMKSSLARRGHKDYAYAVIANYKHDRSLNGLNVVEAARKLHGGASLKHQIETILEIQDHGGASAVFHGMSETDVQQFLRHPNTMFASDSGVREFGEGVPHPRGYGNNARILARYVRELKTIRIEDAIRRMTSLPATTFRLTDRGQVRAGAWADLVVFDPAKVQDHAEFNDPHHYATGFGAVIVNGEVVVRDDKHTGTKSGAILRHGGGGNSSGVL